MVQIVLLSQKDSDGMAPVTVSLWRVLEYAEQPYEEG